MSDTRWKFVTERFGDTVQLKAFPDPGALGDYISRASSELSEKIMEYEDTLIIQFMSTKALERLVEKCKIELQRREDCSK